MNCPDSPRSSTACRTSFHISGTNCHSSRSRGASPARDVAGCSLARTARGSVPSSLSSDEATCRERSEEHTSELQSRFDLVCRLLLEKKKTTVKVTILDE